MHKLTFNENNFSINFRLEEKIKQNPLSHELQLTILTGPIKCVYFYFSSFDFFPLIIGIRRIG